MKKIVKQIFFFTLLAATVASCKKDEIKSYFEGGTKPVLTANKAILALSFATKDDEAITLNWTNPNYQFASGVSSQDVSYLIEIDTTGANFTNPQRQSVAISKELSKSFTQSVFNDYLLNQLVLKPSIPHNIEIRVTSTMAGTAAPLLSNILKFVVTPYAIPPKVVPPSTGKLYLVGSATNGGWNNPVPVPTQEFTQVSATLYEITVPLTGGGSYLCLPLNGDWGTKFGGAGSANNSNNVNGDDFKNGGSDLLAPAASGNYKLSFDFQRGKFTVTKL